MKRFFNRIFLCLVIMVVFLGSALAAGFTGDIWTNSPKRTLGIVYGYYCTAAQNTSSNGTNQYATAWSKKNGSIIASANATGNNRAVANSNLNKPTSGYGEYGEDYGESHMNFGPGAYSDY